jgi:hypothetical protein
MEIRGSKMGTLTRKKHPDRDYPQNPREYGHAHAHNLYKKPNFKENIIITQEQHGSCTFWVCLCVPHGEGGIGGWKRRRRKRKWRAVVGSSLGLHLGRPAEQLHRPCFLLSFLGEADRLSESNPSPQQYHHGTHL